MRPYLIWIDFPTKTGYRRWGKSDNHNVDAINVKAFCFFIISAVIIGARMTDAEIFTFDDLPTVGASALQISNGYGGFQWGNFYALDAAYLPTSGYVNGVISSPNVALNGHGNPGILSGGPFDLNSAYFTAAWNDGMYIEAKGFNGATTVDDETFTVNTSGPTFINFDWVNVTEVEWISFGGEPNPGLSGGGGFQFAMDNLSVTTVPEPSVIAFFGLGAVAFSAGRIRHPTNR